jgi:hypothetical protein
MRLEIIKSRKLWIRIVGVQAETQKLHLQDEIQISWWLDILPGTCVQMYIGAFYMTK